MLVAQQVSKYGALNENVDKPSNNIRGAHNSYSEFSTNTENFMALFEQLPFDSHVDQKEKANDIMCVLQNFIHIKVAGSDQNRLIFRTFVRPKIYSIFLLRTTVSPGAQLSLLQPPGLRPGVKVQLTLLKTILQLKRKI